MHASTTKHASKLVHIWQTPPKTVKYTYRHTKCETVKYTGKMPTVQQNHKSTAMLITVRRNYKRDTVIPMFKACKCTKSIQDDG